MIHSIKAFIQEGLAKSALVTLSLLIAVTLGCGGSSSEVTSPVIDEDNTQVPVEPPGDPSPAEPEFQTDRIYIPVELAGMDLTDEKSQWSYHRSRQSEHFIVFWDKGYGELAPDSEAVEPAYRVDLTDLLSKAEAFYQLNVETLKFAEPLNGSKLADYKMMIFIHHQSEWLATGAGYDNVIGALWVSPSTMQPVGSTIAHEIGHSFQYQVHCDLGHGAGYRHGFGDAPGNAFWEQTAQWQAFQSYPEEAFSSHHFEVYMANHHKHFHHEDQRYASYWLHYYWAETLGQDFIARLWRESEPTEDAIQTYMRLTGRSDEQFNDDFYQAAARLVSWDLAAIRELGKSYIGRYQYRLEDLGSGHYQVADDYAPATAGYNVIPLNVPTDGQSVTANFSGLVEDSTDASRAGWRYGFVALLASGERRYGAMYQTQSGQVSFTIPAGTEKLWFVVTGAPSRYQAHSWDDDPSNDEQWPYQVAFVGTDVLGHLAIDLTRPAEDLTLSFDVTIPVSATEYSSVELALSQVQRSELAQALVMQPSEVLTLLGPRLSFYGVESDGSLNPNRTANGYGHWFDASGNVVDWGEQAVIFAEFDPESLHFTLGQHPGHGQSGEQFKVSQALQLNGDEQSAQITFVFHITLE